MRPITGSGLGRVMQCPASASLPAIVEESSEAAALGTSLHIYLQRVIDNGRAAALSAMPDDVRDACSAIDVEWIDNHTRRDLLEAEVAFSYNAIEGVTSRLGRIGRSYPSPRRGEVFCTVDLVENNAFTPSVCDYKTGRHRVTPVAENWQLRLAALAVRSETTTNVGMRIAYLKDDGTWDFDDYLADEMDLDTWAGELKRGYILADSVARMVEMGATPDVYPSDDACRWCPCKQVCPAKTTALVQFRKAFELAIPGDVKAKLASVDAVSAGEIWTRLSQIIPLVEAAKEAIVERAASEALPLPNGKALRAVEHTRDYIDGNVAFDVINKRHGKEVAEKVCTLSTTKSAMRVLGKDLDATLEKIREAGGVESKTYRLLKEVKK